MILNREKNIKEPDHNGIRTVSQRQTATLWPRGTHHVAPRRTLCLSARAWPLLLAEDQSDEKMKKKNAEKENLNMI